ncbi:TRAP transporter substrate-binding protein [Achromobacter aloeverae]|uniref:ABC transporter substrate-binding protein n=1 Tax=Achromobacter aloeverae TaxID=1750518 RepID=A0A4Q1HPF6_9BURK|nr:TRAP transporter substrate-binding protein [Achromobacter aloeverae]RXN92819.1 ABC transporter substrate-binding protein [Achromobacter aloeverae]
MMLLRVFIRILACAAAIGACGVALAGEPYRLRIVGGLASGNQYPQYEEPFWNHELERLSDGRYAADIVPFDRSGVPGSEMLRLMQLGVVPFGTVLMTTLVAQYPQYTVADLPGLNPDMTSLRASLAAFRPYLEQSLREQHGIEPLAVYVYPAQVLFCKQPLTRLADIAGRRVRVSSAGQADFIGALGATPVHTSFAQVYQSLESGNTDCAVTGTMSGYTLGLYRVTQYLYPLSLNWGMAVFGANKSAWRALPADLRTLLRSELSKLEATIWAASERDSVEGVACNSGAPGCHADNQGHMTVVPISPEDEPLRREVFETVVLRNWLQRCRVDCANIWRQTVGPVSGIDVPTLR